MKLASGRYLIEVSKDGFESFSQWIELKSEDLSLPVALNPLKTGALMISSQPGGAEVSVDGKTAGKSPLTVKDLSPGKHAVHVTLQGYRGMNHSVTLEAGKTTSIDVELVRERTSRFTKLGTGGKELPDNASIWLMVRDSQTGLVWEAKQNSDNVKDYLNPNDADNTYTWYNPNPKTNGGNAGTSGNGTDTEDFIDQLNSRRYGGYSDWRLSSMDELKSIVDSKSNSPGIDGNYLSNPQGAGYWSSNTNSTNRDVACYVKISYGKDYYSFKSSRFYVRAVRGGQ